MPNVTLSVPSDMKEKMEKFREINWSEVAREAISEKLKNLVLLKILDEMTSKSKLTEKEAVELGRLMKKGRFKELKEKGLV